MGHIVDRGGEVKEEEDMKGKKQGNIKGEAIRGPNVYRCWSLSTEVVISKNRS